MDLTGRQELVLTDAEFRMYCELFRGHCGLHFGPDSRFLLEKRLARRVCELDLGSFAAYHYLLESDASGDRELSHIIDELTTNETYFFRERNQLRALIEEILPELRARREKVAPTPVSIWSAGCSSGEEPYSVVMLALEAGFEPGRDLRVYASDISRKMLQKARRGEYRPASFRDTSPELQKKYFAERDGALAHLRRREAPRRLHAPEPARPRPHRAARHDGRDPVPQRDHLLRPRDQDAGDQDLRGEAAPGRLPAARPLRVADQHHERLRALPPAQRHGLPAAAAGRGRARPVARRGGRRRGARRTGRAERS